MTKEEKEGNVLIAKFMKTELQVNSTVHYRYRVSKSLPDLSINELKYHSSWDWQVPVWAKLSLQIKELSKGLSLRTLTEYKIRDYENDYIDAIFDNDVSKGFEAIIDIIEWYNLNKKV